MRGVVKMPKLRVTLSIGIANASQEDVLDIDEEEWLACKNEEDRDKLKDIYYNAWASNYIDGGYWMED